MNWEALLPNPSFVWLYLVTCLVNNIFIAPKRKKESVASKADNEAGLRFWGFFLFFMFDCQTDKVQTEVSETERKSSHRTKPTGQIELVNQSLALK